MAADERLKWLEMRISSSLRPRNEDLKNMIANDDNRLAFYEFVNNEDAKRLFVFMRPSREIGAALQPPMELQTKCIFFLKCNLGTKLTKDNIDSEVFYTDCTHVPLEHLELTIREVFLPLLATNTHSLTSATGSGDKIMDILHRLMAAVEVSQGHVEGRIVLNLPSIEVLAEAAASPTRRAAVLHVLETTVIGWIKQIRGVLRHDPQTDLMQQFGKEPGPLDEIQMWQKHLSRLQSIDDQLDSDIARDILQNLETANSQYAHSFSGVRKEIAKAESETSRILKFLSTMEPWYNKLHTAKNSKSIIKLFKPLMHVLNLVWAHSTYYHQIDKFHHLLRLLSNEVVHRAIAMVGDDILREPLESYSKLKEALRVCAAFRGTYLDFKDKADDQNAQNIAENAERLAARPHGNLFTTKMYGPHAYTPRYGLRHLDGGSSSSSLNEEDLWTDSPWPARNAPCFDLLNSFMERCNDVLELVETTRHFRLLAGAAEVGGAGSSSLDAMVKELHTKYIVAMKDFFSQVKNVLSIDGTQNFERAFFNFRTTVKTLEKKLSGILRIAFEQCPIVQAQLRLLEVFEGISGRELVQIHLKDIDKTLVDNFTEELKQVKDMYREYYIAPPAHYNMPPSVSKLMWVHALKERIQIPMQKMKKVSPHSLEGDRGWQMRDMYNEVMQELEKFESSIISKWQTDIVSELTQKLKQPLLIAEEYDDDIDVRPQVIHVNLDSQLLLLLKEIHYLSKPPFSIHLPEAAKDLLRNTNSHHLSVTATRLETIVSKYNSIMRSITAFERPMFERKLAQVDNLLEQGLQHQTWKMKESADFIESAMSLVCLDVHQNLDIVQTNCHEIAEMTMSWSKRTLDVFSAREKSKSYSMDELLAMHKQLNDDLESLVVPAGNKIHSLVQESYEVVQISQASPAWRDYVDYIDAIVLDGLKQTTLASLKIMLNTLVQANFIEDPVDSLVVPILTIRLELIENDVAFRPPLDQNTSVVSVQELIQTWLQSYLARGKLINMLGPKGIYEDYIAADDEVKQLLSDINQVVDDNSEECKKLLDVFKEYAFLWQQDVNQTFEDFLSGFITPNPLRTRSEQRTVANKQTLQQTHATRSERSSQASRASSAKSAISAEALESAERTFLTPKAMQEGEKSNVPSLDEFDHEIDIYRTARDEIMGLEEYHNIGWIRVDLQPIKQVLITFASKWMWTFTKYLSDQVTSMLDKLDLFLKRIEPEIESITGEERDTASFMKMMRLFNEVSAQQSEMDGKFAAMHKTVLLLKKYGQILPEKTQFLFNAAPGRWNNLKTKVSLAKQRLGPRIQEESARITQDLEAFAVRVSSLSDDLDNSDVYQRECSITDAYNIIDGFSKRLIVLENEAQDLFELQELLEASVVNFSILPTCRHELYNLKQVWETVRVIEDQQAEWKRHRWQKMNTKFLREETNKQLDIVRALPEDVFTWDVYMGLHESITMIQACLPLIDDLSNPAMRTRHWKQLVRVTGGALTIDNDTLKRMTLRELLSLGLQQHVDDVRAIVQRAVKDLAIENALKTYEEVWLSKVFELRYHVRSKIASSADVTQDNQSEYSQSEIAGPVSIGASRNARTTSRVSNQSSHSKNKRSSISSLPASLLNLGEDPGTLMLLTNTDPIFEELEHHQVTLQAMQSNSAAGSFLDEVLKWQKKLQTIEAVLQIWLEVQDKWVEMEEVYSSPDVRQSLSHDTNRFALVNKDFRLLMRATEKNPNVLQCCSRKNILKILEHMARSLEACRKSLMRHLEKRRQIFPRFFFLSMEDVLHIVCNGYDLAMVNLYISKLLENVGQLVYEEADDNDRYSFIISGVESTLGERMTFNQAVCCEGQIETWLSSLLSQMKSSLQMQLNNALGHESTGSVKSREIHSAGARKVSVPVNETETNETANEPVGDHDGNTTSPDPKIEPENGTDVPSLQAHESLENVDQHKGKSWTLEHVTEIVYLATRIQTCHQISDALDDFNSGNKDALMGPCEKIDASIKATVLLLKGLEGEKEGFAAQQREKQHHAASGQDIGSELEAPGIKSPFPKGSQDAMGDRNSQFADEDLGSRVFDGESKGEVSTVAPLDTMNLIMPTTTMEDGNTNNVTNGGQDDTDGIPAEKLTDLKLMLFPSQIHKLTSLLSLLAHLRDLMQRLINISNHHVPSESFDWKSQLNYEYNGQDKAPTVTCLKARFEYGFEYLGSANREVISPLTEKVFVTITQAIQAHMGLLAVGPREGTKYETVCEAARCLGHPLYMFSCAKTTDYFQLQDIFRGIASTGCWACFNDISLLRPACLSVLAQLMSSLMEALRAGKAAVHLQSDDVQLSSHGACFGLVSSAVPVSARDCDKLLIYPSAIAQLPDAILNQFRVISLSKPDLLHSLQVFLFRQGFMYGRELAWKTNQLYETCQNMFGANTFVAGNITLGEMHSASFYGWSVQTLKGVVEEAGALLEKAQTEDKDTGLSTIQGYEPTENIKAGEHSETLVIAAKKLQQEDEALITALRDTFLPRMTSRDASVFATIVHDLWPNTEVAMTFGGEVDDQGNLIKAGSLQTLKSEMRVKSSRSQDSQRSIKDSLNLNTPVIPMIHASTDKFSTALDTGTKQVLEDINDAIAVATADLGLLPGTAFQARVMQLAQLNSAHQSILVVGPPGCGKSECIKTFAVAERERGKQIIVQSIFTKAVESGELLGHFDESTREWKDGLLTALLRKFCVTSPNSTSLNCKTTMKIMQLDGECDSYQMELLQTILNHTGSVVMTNNERLKVPETLRFIWELESLENMSPSLLATVGVLMISASDVGWKLMLVQWLEHRNEPDKDLLTEFCNIYLEPVVDFITRCTQPAMLRSKKESNGQTPQFKRMVSHSLVNMVRTFTNLLEVLINPFNDLSDVEYERYFNYAAVWAFGGTLAEENRQDFSDWWKEQFEEHIDYPSDGTVFDYIVDNETHEFCKWNDLVPSYTGSPHQGIPHDAFVHTVHTEQLLHLLGLLTDAGKPVMLVGENGCGKTAIINERMRTVCSGEVAEVLSLAVYANRFTNARLLFDRMDERLEWKHGRTFIPRGNKRLLCLIDDINLSQADSYGFQTACELIREHLDDGGFYSPTNHMWRYVKNVTYVTSVNPQTTASAPALSQRLLRHFAVFGCPYPRAHELQTIFSTLLATHFFTPESSSSSSSAAQHLGIHDDKGQSNVRFDEESLRSVVVSIVKVTVELSDRMRSMFLPTAQRCHYVFTTKDLGNIFRNICLSLQPGCNKRNLLLLWQHECFWVYGKRMVNEVDFRRFRQAFVTAVRKQFIDDDQIHTIIKPRPQLFSNLIEQDSGIVTAGMIDTRSSANVSEEDAKTDVYRPAKSFKVIKDLLERGVEEYNKIHPRIKLALYKTVIEQVCRLSRVIASPHEGANTVLVAEGCPGRCSIIVRFAANLCGFTIFQINASQPHLTPSARMQQFKADLVSGYIRAGAKGERILLLLHEEELVNKDYLVFLMEFIVSGSITHLFSQEEQTTIINSIRTEVTQAGLTYTREVAWNFFLRTVRNNFRIILITCGGAEEFQHMCREYPAFTKNVNFMWFPHWSKTQLIEHAVFHLMGVAWMTDIQRENVAHMLASMHLVLRQQDGGEKTSGDFGHVNNTSYEKFVERFISLSNERHANVTKTHEAVTKTLQQIRHENEIAIKLKKQLEHEIVVLEERKAGTIKILSQIGQDTAITEQQIRVVRNQMERITHLKKLLPEYQVAHERAVYKAIAIVADTKKVVKLMDIDDLAELRAMQKPALDIEDLMSAIIMLLKSPSADLTWQKGAKRQMANLERFIEELTTFDDFQQPESTLLLVEPYLKKLSFDPETLEKKTGNSACGALCKWVRGVVKYHRMMISKVKPLHQKVEETTQAVDHAQHKMNTLENKRKALEIRLTDLARGFEEATIDKNEQEEKTIRMKKMLDTAAQLRRILRGEGQRCQQIFDSYERRVIALPGGCAMAAAFATYLGPYHHNFRRVMLTVHWPGCLRERGIPLVIDSVDGLRGRVIDWSIAFLKTASGASSVYEVDYANLLQNMDGTTKNYQAPADLDYVGDVKDKPDYEEKETDETEKLEDEDDGEMRSSVAKQGDDTKDVMSSKADIQEDNEDRMMDKKGTDKNDDDEKRDEEKKEDIENVRSESGLRETSGEPSGEEDMKVEGRTLEEVKSQTPAVSVRQPAREEDETVQPPPDKSESGPAILENAMKEEGADYLRLSKVQEEDGDLDDDLRSEVTASTAPILTSTQYNRYMRSLIKILVGDSVLNEWLMKDFGPRQMENAAIMCTSWQRPPMMIDPNQEGSVWLSNLNKTINARKLISLDMDNRHAMSDPHIMSSLEKAITKGKPVLLKNCGESLDSMIVPLMHNRNTANEKDLEEEPRMILFCGRRTLCHPDFRLYLSTHLSKPNLNPVTASNVSLINFGVSHDTLTDDLLTRVFARIRPELYQERNHALRNLQLQKDTLYKFSETVKDQVLSGGQEAMLSSPKALQFITNITDAKLQLAHQLSSTQVILDDLDLLKDELYPIARRASLMYSIMGSLGAIYPEYQFTMKYFLELFDEAVGGDLPPGFSSEKQDDGFGDGESIGEVDKRQRTDSINSQASDVGKTADGQPTSEKDGDDDQAEEGGKLAPTETEESASTGAVQKLVHGSESDELPTIEMPDTMPLPSDGVEYTSYTTAKIKALMDSVTSLIYHRVKMCLFEEDRLLFTTLVCLNMKVEAGEAITNEEMSLFLQGNPGLGMQLTLLDFDCKADPPDWLSREKWEDILALSVLLGPLDSLCVDFANNSDQWKEWYQSPYPEKVQLPLRVQSFHTDADQGGKIDEGNEKHERKGDRGSAGQRTPDLAHLNDFHQLLILRMLRPDRLPTALLAYTQRHLALYDPEEEVFNVHEVLAGARKHFGVLVLLPPAASNPSGHPASRLKLTKTPMDEIVELAKAANIPVERTIMSEGTTMSLEEVLDSADKNEGWAIIESVHLSTPAAMEKLIHHLQRIHKSRVNFKAENGEEESKFCVWLTSETNSCLPASFVQNLLKISWNSVLSYPDLSAKTESDEGNNVIQDTFNPLSPRSYLKTAIVSSLRLIPEDTLETLRERSALTKGLVFAVAVIHAILVSRQLFGSVGQTRWYPFGKAQITNAVEYVTSQILLPKDETEPSLEDLCFTIPNLVYNAMVSEDPDKAYIQSLSSHIIESIYKEPQSEILLGGSLIPVPPDTVEPKDVADWFEQVADDKMTMQVLQLNSSVEKSANDSSSTKFVSRLDRMFETQNMEAGDVSPWASPAALSVVKLRSALDICLESMPLLLELGDVPQLMKAEYDFPYHCPSIISMSSAESTLMPESIGYVLLQECFWMNTILCHIRQEITDLQINILGGSGSLPRKLLPTAYSLQEECVPVSWIHPNCQPCTHSLVSWLEDLNKRHQQLYKWVKRSMVPVFADGQLSESHTIARGQLTKIWLGGLVSPQALLTALRQEKAILEKVDLEHVQFECVIPDSVHQDEFELEEGGIFVSNIYLENAAWDPEASRLMEAKDAGMVCIKCVYLRPVLTKANKEKVVNTEHEVEEETEERAVDDGTDNCPPLVCHLPVYMNKSRQIQAWTLPVKCPSPEEKWILCRAAFVLDPGLPDGGCKKSRAYLMLQRLPPLLRTSQEEDEGEDEMNEQEEDNETNVEDSVEESTQSQLSYRPMSPRAPPLPEGLVLQREAPVYDDNQQIDKAEDIRPVSRASKVSEAYSRGKLNESDGRSKHDDGNVVDVAGGENQGKEYDEKENEPLNPEQGKESAEDAHDIQGENDRGNDKNVTEDSVAVVPDLSRSEDAQSKGEVIHPGNREGGGPRSSEKITDKNNSVDDTSGPRATENSESNETLLRPRSTSNNQGRGREEETPSRKNTASRPTSVKTAVLPANQMDNKPTSRGKMSSEEEVTNKETGKSEKSDMPSQRNKQENNNAEIITQVTDDTQLSDSESNKQDQTHDDQARAAVESARSGTRGRDFFSEPAVPPVSERSEDTNHLFIDMRKQEVPTSPQ